MRIYSIIRQAFDAAAFERVDSGLKRREGGRLSVNPSLLEALSRKAFGEIAFYFRKNHLSLLCEALKGKGASANDRLVIETLLRNAIIAAKGELALCQDTGTACVYAWKDESVYTGSSDDEAISRGIALAYGEHCLRASQIEPLSFFRESNTRNNLPAQIHIESVLDEKNPAYRFLFAAKGGGSANKTSFHSMTKALLEKAAFEKFLAENIRLLGTAACPPYRLTVVVGGPSPEFNLTVNKLASTEILDCAPFFAADSVGADSVGADSVGTDSVGADGHAGGGNWLWRDAYWENRAMELGRESGLGAQFGGSCLLLAARVFRMPRHAASCPVSLGVSCCAHRNMLGYIDESGLYLEKLAKDPSSFLKGMSGLGLSLQSGGSDVLPEVNLPLVNLDRPMEEIRRELSRCKTGDKVMLSGSLIVARDAAHLKWHEMLSLGEELPGYLLEHPVYYAGPSETPPGKVIGSLGPTTAGRMDIYGEELMSRGASLVTLAKGNRSDSWLRLCQKYGGFYLGAIGGAGALPAEENIVSQTIIDCHELGMEAVRLIEVRNLLAFIIIDDKGSA